MNKEECQLQVVYEAGEELTLIDRLINYSLRLISALHRRLERIGAATRHCAPRSPGIGVEGDEFETCEQGSPADDRRRMEFVPGEMVEVLPYEEIRKTLDENGCFEGLGFMSPMRRYCGRKVRVLKKVRTIFDERNWKMVKIRNSYLLEGVVCEGRDVFEGEGCDRSCFFFWKDKWLRKTGVESRKTGS